MEMFFAMFEGVGLYLIVLGVLVALGFGLPFSEDLVLIAVGFFVYTGDLRLIPALIVSYCGSMIGDYILFNIGYHLGDSVMKHRFVLRIISHGRREKMLDHFRKYGDKFIIFARFVAGVRAPTFLTAGLSKMHPLRFILFDAVASLVTVPLLVGLGYLFGDHVEVLKKGVTQFQHIAVVVVIASLALYILARYLNLFRKDKDDEF